MSFGRQGGASGGGLKELFGGLFGDSGAPYEDAMDEYTKWGAKGEAAQRPYQEAGTRAIPAFQQWLSGMQDPSGFINSLMDRYHQSPWAKYQQEQSARRYGNAGSASGLTGSTPLEQFEMQNAHDISEQDIGDWLNRVLGINSLYGSGQNNLIQTGANSANALTNMFGDLGSKMGEAAFGKRAGENYDRNNIWGGAFDIVKNGLFG